jgi:spore coat polysaccharide biosynthesis protein SpsF (cytidylyltransferase family)
MNYRDELRIRYIEKIKDPIIVNKFLKEFLDSKTCTVEIIDCSNDNILGKLRKEANIRQENLSKKGLTLNIQIFLQTEYKQASETIIKLTLDEGFLDISNSDFAIKNNLYVKWDFLKVICTLQGITKTYLTQIALEELRDEIITDYFLDQFIKHPIYDLFGAIYDDKQD